jgi:hypothetical protein
MRFISKIKESGLIHLQLQLVTLFIEAGKFHVFLNLLLYELLKGLSPFLLLGVFISQGLILHFE